MFIFQDSSGRAHAIEGAESLHKAMGLPCSQRVVVMTDEAGQFVSAGRTAHDLGRNADLVKSLRDGEALAKAQKGDNIIQMNRKLKTDKVQTRARAGEIGRHDRLDGSKIVKASVVKHTKSDIHPLFDRYEEVNGGHEEEDEDYQAEQHQKGATMTKSFRRNSMLELIDELQDLKDKTQAARDVFIY
jgi:hypothetical protein